MDGRLAPGQRLTEERLARRAWDQPHARPRGAQGAPVRGARRRGAQPERHGPRLRARRPRGHLSAARPARGLRRASRSRTSCSDERLRALRASCERFEAISPAGRPARGGAGELRLPQHRSRGCREHPAERHGQAGRSRSCRSSSAKSSVWYSPEQARISQRCHRRITRALEHHDAERAELVMLKERVLEARDVLIAHVEEVRATGVRGARRPDITEHLRGRGGAPVGERRRRAARGRAGSRARAAARGTVRGPAAGDLGRGGRRGGGPRSARPAPGMGQGALRGSSLLVARAVPQREVRHAGPAATNEGQRAPARARRALPTCSWRTSGPERSSGGISATSGSATSIPGSSWPGCRATGRAAVREAGRVGLGSRGDGRPAPYQRLPGRAAAAHAHLARRLARRHVRTSRASSAALYWRDALGGGRGTGRRVVADGGLRSRCSRARCRSTTASASCASRKGRTWRGSRPRTSSSPRTASG